VRDDIQTSTLGHMPRRINSTRNHVTRDSAAVPLLIRETFVRSVHLQRGQSHGTPYPTDDMTSVRRVRKRSDPNSFSAREAIAVRSQP
jgi:hypothetical protein